MRLLVGAGATAAGLAIWYAVTGGDSSAVGSDPAAVRIDGHRQRGDVEALAREAAGADTAAAVRAVEALGDVGARSIRHLERAMKDPRPVVREQAALSLGRTADREHTEALAGAVTGDESPDVRAAAATALGCLYAYNEVPNLLAALDDPDPLVRKRADAAFRRITGIDFGYRPDGRLEQRREVLARIRRLWPGIEPEIRQYYAARAKPWGRK